MLKAVDVKSKLLLLLVMLFSMRIYAQWQPSGPYVGNIQCVVSNGSNMFAGTNGGGVYITGAGGWIPKNNGLTNLKIQSLAPDHSPAIKYYTNQLPVPYSLEHIYKNP